MTGPMKRFPRAWRLLGMLLAATAVSCSREDPPASVPQTEEVSARLEQLVQERNELDRTVFAMEVRAQTRDQFIVAMWDRMRRGDGFSVLQSVPLEKLLIGPTPQPQPMDWGIGPMRRWAFGEPTRSLDAAAIRSLLDKYHLGGWRIDQSEWHHKAFVQGKAGGPDRSTISASVHVRNGARRAQLEAVLEIEWPEDLLAGPRLLRIKKLDVWDQTGTPAFGVAHEIDPSKLSGGKLPKLAPVVVMDLDGDDRPEIVLPQANLIYRNEGDFKFRAEDLCRHPLPLDQNALVADFDGDGLPDLVGVDMKKRKLVLYKGEPKGKFPHEAVVCSEIALSSPMGFTAGDIDGDGDLDLFMGQYLMPYENGQVATPYYDANDGLPNYLLVNDGHGRFRDVTEEAGLGARRHRRTWQATLVDLDQDNDLDLAVICDFAGVDLWRNNGKGFFTDATEQMAARPKAFGMGSSIADYNGDGRLDFYLIGMSSTTASRLMKMKVARPGFEMENKMRGPMSYGNRMLLGTESGTYHQADWADRVARTGWSWGVSGADFDNDGDRDIYVANGNYCTRFWCHDIYLKTPEPSKPVDRLLEAEGRTLRARQTSYNGYEHNFFFVDDGRRGYQNLSYLAGVAFEFDCRSVVGNDLNGDGRVDLLVSHKRFFQPADWLLVCRNRLENSGHWLAVRLKPSKKRPWPIGARVEARAGDRTFVHAVVTGDSFQAQHDMVAHFGLGSVQKVDWVQVRWPDGTVSRIETPAVDRTHVVEAASGK